MPRIAPTRTVRGIEIGPAGSSFGRRVTLVNPEDQAEFAARRGDCANGRARAYRYVFAFGQISPTYLLAWGGFEDAFEAACAWLKDHAPGVFGDELVEEEHARCLAEGESEDDAWEHALVDMTVTASGYILSDHWMVVAVNPTRAELDALLYAPGVEWSERTHCADDNSRWLSRCTRRHHPTLRMEDAPLVASEPCGAAVGADECHSRTLALARLAGGGV